jgi:hypothetical protein
MAEWSMAHAWKAIPVMLIKRHCIASPRNGLYDRPRDDAQV